MLFLPDLRSGLLACASLAALWLPPGPSMAKPVAATNTDRLAALVDQTLQTHPEIQAAQAAVAAAQALLAGSALPLNNPDLALETEHTDIDTYRLGISQTLDWHNKQGAQQQLAQARLAAAQQQFQALKLAKAAELLDAIGGIINQQQISHLVKKRSDTLARFARLAKRLHSAGDIPLAELELARLSLAEALMQQARSEADLVQAKSNFFALSGQQLPSSIKLPKQLTDEELNSENDVAIARNHPAVQSAHTLSQVARQQIRVVDQGRKVDPTLGLAAGREGRENLLGLSISLPLQVRNDFRSEVNAAQAESLQAEQEAQQVFRSTVARLQAARQRYQLTARAWSVWFSNGQTSLQQRLALLERQWQAGEMNSTDYLLQIQQSLETRITATELQGDVWRTWIEWLSASARLNSWLHGTPKEQ